MAQAFDPRLITAQRLLELAGEHALTAGSARPGQALEMVTLDCFCGQPIARLTDLFGAPYKFSAGQLLQDVLRHLVMAHDVALSGVSAEKGEETDGK